MTVERLYRLLQKEISQGHGKKPIVVSKTTFIHNCEADGCTLFDIAGVETKWTYNADDDGRIRVNKDGTESGRVRVILYGDSYDPNRREK